LGKGIIEYFRDMLSAQYDILFDSARATTAQLSIKESLMLYYGISILSLVLFIAVGSVFFGSPTGRSIPNNNLFAGMVSLLYALFITGNFNYLITIPFSGVAAVVYLAVLYILILFPLEIVIVAAAMHLVGNNALHKFKRPFDRTFAAIMFAFIPQVTFVWIVMFPVFSNFMSMFWYNLIVLTWSILLFFDALSNQQKIEKTDVGSTVAAGGVIGLVLLGLAVVVLITGGLSMGVFSGASLLGTTCIAGSGYYCGSLAYAHGTSQITASVGQSTGSDWSNVYVAFVPQGTSVSAAGTPILSAAPSSVGTLDSGQQVSVQLPTGQPSPTVGSSIAGAIWTAYGSGCDSTAFSSAPDAQCDYVQVATLTAKAS
jgi:hypothetical protein